MDINYLYFLYQYTTPNGVLANCINENIYLALQKKN